MANGLGPRPHADGSDDGSDAPPSLHALDGETDGVVAAAAAVGVSVSDADDGAVGGDGDAGGAVHRHVIGGLHAGRARAEC